MISGLGKLAIAGTAVWGVPAAGASISHSTFGSLPDGRPVPAVTLANGSGFSATVIAYGAALQSFVMPDRQGKRDDVTLGYAAIGDYVSKPQYFGASVGRVANRIAKGRFMLNGKTYQTPVNNGEHSLHGGTGGFDKALWDIVDTDADVESARVTLRYLSADSEMGYPGALTVFVTYTLDETSRLRIEYRATTNAATVVNITNHAYWNLAGEGAASGAMGHVLTIPAETYLPVDAGLIPTGELRPVAGTVFDFRKPRIIGKNVRDAEDQQIVFGRGYDHNFIIAREAPKDMHLMARVQEPVSGRAFELWSNQRGLQFYSGNFLDGTSSGKARKSYRQGDAFCLEPQAFPDTVNQPEFGSARLDPGKEYRNVMEYRFAVER